MTTAATLLIDTLAPTAKPAGTGVAVSGQPSIVTPFAALLTEGNFVQPPGTVPTEGGGLFGPAGPLPVGEIGPAVDGEALSADPAFNVIPLFDTTALSTPALTAPIPGFALGVTTQPSNGATSDGVTIAPTSGIPIAPLLAPTAGQTANPIPAAPTDSPLTTPARTLSDQPVPTPVETDNSYRDHPMAARPAAKGFTAADVMAEIAQFSADGAGLVTAAAEAPPVTPGVRPASTPAPVTIPAPVTAPPAALPAAIETPAATNTQALPQQASASAEPLAVPTALAIAAGAAVAAAPTTAAPTTSAPMATGGQAAREGEAPDPRVTSQIVQVNVPAQTRATATRAAAKPATGLSSALSGDVALAAMANESRRPGMTKPMSSLTPTANQGASVTAAGLNSAVAEIQPNPQMASQRQPLTLVSQDNPPPAPAARAGEQAAPMAEFSDQQAAPRMIADARVELPQAASQPMRAGEAVAQPDRPMSASTSAPTSAPTPLPALPAEQVAMQLRHAVAKGVDRINIQLSPASLGAIEISLDVSNGARVVVHVVAEKAETLEMMRADVRGLERALQEAGLRTDSGSLNFNLRGDGNGASHQNSAALKEFDENGTAGDGDTDTDADADDAPQESPARQASSKTLDIEV